MWLISGNQPLAQKSYEMNLHGIFLFLAYDTLLLFKTLKKMCIAYSRTLICIIDVSLEAGVRAFNSFSLIISRTDL